MPALIDTHAHLDLDRFDPDRYQTIQRAFDAGIQAIITVGTSPARWETTMRLCDEYESIFPVLGYHPNDLPAGIDEQWPELSAQLKKLRPIAIGETGLDHYWDHVPRDRQHRGFYLHIELATDLGIPLVVHCRDAYDDCLAILSEAAPLHVPVLLHCFSAGPKEAEAAADLGLYVSFAGPLTYPNNHALRQAAQLVPLDYLLVETDCPFLPPQQRRGKRNEPAYVLFTAEKLAEIRNMGLDELCAVTTGNARRFFKLC